MSRRPEISASLDPAMRETTAAAISPDRAARPATAAEFAEHAEQHRQQDQASPGTG